MLQRIFRVGDTTLELTLEGMSFDGADGEILDVLTDFEENGVTERTGEITDDYAIERTREVTANVYSADTLIDLLERMGFSPREVYDYTDDGPPGG